MRIFAKIESCAVVVSSGERILSVGRVVSGESTSGIVVGETGSSVVVISGVSFWTVVRKTSSSVVIVSVVTAIVVVCLGESTSSVGLVVSGKSTSRSVVVSEERSVVGVAILSVVVVGDSIGSGESIFMIGWTDN